MNKVYLFSMDGCPHCQDMKSMLDSENIEYDVKDVEEYKDEYDEFIKLVDIMNLYQHFYVLILKTIKLTDTWRLLLIGTLTIWNKLLHWLKNS